MARGIKTGGRKKGSLNKATRARRAVAESVAQALAQLDKSMAATPFAHGSSRARTRRHAQHLEHGVDVSRIGRP